MKLVVHPAVDHVDPLQPARGAQVDHVVAHEQVAALDQLDAHPAGQQGVLEVGAVVDAGREEHDDRLGDARRRGGDQRVEQPARVVVDRARVVALEEARELPPQRVPVLEHVRDPRRRAQVVLEHEELAGVVAHQVDPRDVDVDVARRPHPDRLALEVLRGPDQRARHDPVAQHPALAVEVAQELVEREHALRDAARDAVPLVPRRRCAESGRRAGCARCRARRRTP